ncbi:MULTISPECIES: DoxX family protein [Dyadobacter]|uniref:DoxX family protein n=1 Tax=Dyadobacter chenhuakuii TaxID=2909339 RepID=A0A9X1TT80_9BACT|nr:MULTISPECIES: DoxX family protein [Dyadobacter]MCE7068836.1 DoxX family protein [Dyadobacter sp. CY327]MCF2495650.1 DoxX family protein [Dyadobacter chenhuakuii]MCF2499899.1 DoxX family protein [Dyadobacter chenhuakuii]MCF2520143.1 DoxX family protein [Dyadobacter sp. CY351]USJ29684.1 DoxX family protein [Dyadobacter chenhuakuii]
MNMMNRIEHWGDTHHPAWLDIVRIALGVFLFVKGISFISDTTRLSKLVTGLDLHLYTVASVHYVAFAHIFGGFLIALGCLTRISAIIQIPILLVAVFFVNFRSGFSYLNSELWLSMITLILVVTFAVVGSGKLSMDEWMKMHDR